VTRLRAAEPVLKRRTFFLGRAIRGAGVADMSWFKPNGHELTDDEWKAPMKSLGMRLAGDLIRETDEHGEPIVGETLLALFNAGTKTSRFTLPATNPEHVWELLLDTADDRKPHTPFPGGAKYEMVDHSLALFRTRSIQERDSADSLRTPPPHRTRTRAAPNSTEGHS
jgi:isoamylase